MTSQVMTRPTAEQPAGIEHADVDNQMLPEETPELRELYRSFEAEHLMPLWTQIDDLMPMHPAPKAVPHVWKWSDALSAGRACRATWCRSAAAASGGRSASPTPGLAGAPTSRPTLWAAIQYLGPEGDRAGAPAHPERLPLRRRGRGRVDGRQRRPGADEPRRLPADAGLELPRPPQRDRPADGLDRRPGHPVLLPERRRLLRVRRGAGDRRRHPELLPRRAAVVPPGPAPAVGPAGHRRARRSAPTAGSTPTAP